MSLYLFILTVEVLAGAIRSHRDIHGVIKVNHEHKLSLYADDTMLLMSDHDSLEEKCIETVNDFGKLVGLKLNSKQTKFLHFESTGLDTMGEMVKLLGVKIGHNSDKELQDNTQCVMDKKFKPPLKSGGCKTMSSAHHVSRKKLQHVLPVLHSPPLKLLQELNSSIYKFL